MSPWLSVIPPSSLAIDIAIEIFSSFRIADFVVEAVDVVDVLVAEIVAFPPTEHLAFEGIIYTPSIIVSFLIFLLHSVLELRQKRELTFWSEFLSQFFAPMYQKSVDAEPIYRNHGATKHLNVFLIIVVVDYLPYSSMSNFPLWKTLDARDTVWPDSVTKWVSSLMQFCPTLCLVYQNKSCNMYFLAQVPRMTNDRQETCEHTSKLL